MGHIRLGRLPKSRSWHKVFQVLEGDSLSASGVAGAVAVAAQRELSTLQRDCTEDFLQRSHRSDNRPRAGREVYPLVGISTTHKGLLSVLTSPSVHPQKVA